LRCDIDHERDITLAIHAAIPDLARETNRHVSRWLMALARRFAWNSRAKPVWQGKIQTQSPQRGAVTNRKAHSMTDNEIATNFHRLPEVPMNPHDELLLWHALHRLEVTYWYDVDFNEGRTAHEFFTPDGVKMVGHNRFEGREHIRAFYEWRARQNVATAVRQLGISGVRAVRHLITNLYVASSSEGCATVRGIVIFYGGKSKLPSNSPMVADLINECVLNNDNVWRFKSHTLQPVFMSNESPPSMQIDPNFLKQHVSEPHHHRDDAKAH
jgi:SnoaL-like domain